MLHVLIVVVGLLVIGTGWRLERALRQNASALNALSTITADLAIAESRDRTQLYAEMEAGIQARLDGSVLTLRKAN